MKMPLAFFILALQIAVPANPYLKNPIADIIKTGFEASSDRGMWNLEFGFDVWKAKVVDREGMLASERSLGDFSGYDVIWWEIISDHNCVSYVSSNYRNGPLFLLLQGYKGPSGWNIRRIEQVDNIKHFIPLQTGPENVSGSDRSNSTGRASAFSSWDFRELSRTMRSLQFEIRRLSAAVDILSKQKRATVVDSVGLDSASTNE